jgi:Ribose 5-phosphate isomerase A (phosphoriboisomerase A)
MSPNWEKASALVIFEKQNLRPVYAPLKTANVFSPLQMCYTGFPLPVEITPFCHEHTRKLIESLPTVSGCKAVLRMGSISNNKNDGDKIAVTDNGNYIIDLFFDKPIKVYYIDFMIIMRRFF